MLWIPDVSEHQAPVNYDAFAGPIIVRAHNGYRADLHWLPNVAGAVHQPWWATYQYLPANVDPATAAHAFLNTLAAWRPACTILDLEEGSGDQAGRQRAWLEVMAGDPATDWTYSGLYFARAHNLQGVQWIAAYGQREPTDAHLLWQATDAHTFPGIGVCDGSTFNGSLSDLAALTAGTTNPTALAQEDDDMPATLVLLDDGAVIALPANGGRPWHVPDPTVLAIEEFAHLFGPLPTAPLNAEQSASVRNALDRAEGTGPSSPSSSSSSSAPASLAGTASVTVELHPA